MSVINFCDENVGFHETDLCPVYLPGGVSAVIAVMTGNRIADPSDTEEVNAAIIAGWAKVISGVTLDIPRGSDITVDSPVACAEPIVMNRTNTVNILDGNVKPTNDEFWNSLDGRQLSQIIAFECETDYVTNISPNGPISVSVAPVLPASNGELQRYEFVGTFRGKGKINKATKPTGIIGIDVPLS